MPPSTSKSVSVLRASAAMVAHKVTVMMNGLPGAMGHEVAAACLRRGFSLAPVALTGAGASTECEVVEGSQKVKVELVSNTVPEKQRSAVEKLQAEHGTSLVIVDFTHPSAVNPNAEIYTSLKVPFVMGTTGGDSNKLTKDTVDSETYAVIAPNMCKQIVAFQATMERMATDFPNAFGGYRLNVTESHQSTKADTSGTAKAVVGSLNKLGVTPQFEVEHITKLRKTEDQQSFGVPAEALKGHAWHTYTLTSGDGSVEFQFKHNVCGRRTYAEGVADAVEFLMDKVMSGSKKRLFNMIDVLEEGKMQ